MKRSFLLASLFVFVVFGFAGCKKKARNVHSEIASSEMASKTSDSLSGFDKNIENSFGSKDDGFGQDSDEVVSKLPSKKIKSKNVKSQFDSYDDLSIGASTSKNKTKNVVKVVPKDGTSGKKSVTSNSSGGSSKQTQNNSNVKSTSSQISKSAAASASGSSASSSVSSNSGTYMTDKDLEKKVVELMEKHNKEKVANQPSSKQKGEDSLDVKSQVKSSVEKEEKTKEQQSVKPALAASDVAIETVALPN